jgi:DNA-binding response OmpR family regulator
VGETNETKPTVLHVCTRETLRPLRDEILRINGFTVASTMNHGEGLSMFRANKYDLVLIDVEGEAGIADAEKLCAAIRGEKKEQLVGFVCNWRVAALTDCPDEILRTEFDPQAFVEGVHAIVPNAPM